MSAPRLPPEIRRDRFVAIRLSPSEHLLLMKSVVRSPKKLAVFVREAAIEKARRTVGSAC